MKQIICKVNEFSLNHSIFLVDESNIISFVKDTPIDELVYDLYEIGNQNDTFNYHFYGLTDYIHPYGEALASKIISEYKDRDFEIEYN